MRRRTLAARSLAFYWRSNLAVVLGVAVAVAVLAGALLVGESVRGTLRDMALSRLGATEIVVHAPDFVSSRFAGSHFATDARGRGEPGIGPVAPILAFDGFVTSQASGRRAGSVRVYGVHRDFWNVFHGLPDMPLEDRSAFLSPGLADDLGAKAGDPILVRIETPSDIPLESLHGRKENHGRSIRAEVQAVLSKEQLGEFSLSPQQGTVRAVFLPIDRLDRELDLGGRINTMLVRTSAGVGSTQPAPHAVELVKQGIRDNAMVEDLGVTLARGPDGSIQSVGSRAGLIDPRRADAVRRAAASAGLRTEPIFTYLANAIRIGDRSIPYSLVTARSLDAVAPSLPRSVALSEPRATSIGPATPSGSAPVVLNDWAARDLGARVGDAVTLDYYLWEEPGRLVTRSAAFTVAAVVAIQPEHRHLAPVYPGITESPTLDDWDPPFPLDLSRVRRVDEEYWRDYRTTPKAFIRLEDGQRLWGSRYGSVTSVLLSADDASSRDTWQRFEQALRRELISFADDFIVRDVRAEALAASTGATDFGQYFVYFSFFIVVSALVLAALFFKLGVEQRVREIGLLSAVGAGHGFVRRQFMTEAIVLSLAGGLAGMAGALGYAAVIVHLLNTRWVDAVGTNALSLHVSPVPLVAGVTGGVAAAVVCTWLALRSLRAISARALLAGTLTSGPAADEGAGGAPRWQLAMAASATGAFALAGAGVMGHLAPAGAFFGAAAFMLAAGLAAVAFWYRRPPTRVLQGRGWVPLARLGMRSAASRPVRSALTVAVIAAATFIVIAVDAFRKDDVRNTGPDSGVGGYALVVESILPLAHDLTTSQGLDAANLSGLEGVRFAPFRLRPGDDASCLNLYRPVSPRVLGVPRAFADEGRFSFRRSLAGNEPERANPWLLLWRRFDDGAIPVIADANSLQYVLHKSVGDDITVDNAGAQLRLRVVAALADSVFQREILVAEHEFVRAFPDHEGYRFLLAEAPAGGDDVAARIEDGLSALGADVTRTTDRLAEFHRVENTYLATFQTLGALGLLLGTVGLAAVLLRSVLERRRELALLGAVGFEPRHLRLMLLAESASLLVFGLLIGAAAAAVATVPAVLERGGRVPVSAAGAVLVAAILAAGVIATALAARVAVRQPLIDALRSE